MERASELNSKLYFQWELGIILLQAQRSNTTIMSTFNTVEYNPYEEHYH